MPTPAGPIGIHSQAVAGQSVPPQYTQFISEWYKRSDAADDDAFLALMEPNIKFAVHGERNGHEEVRQARRGSTRKNLVHRFHHIMLVDPNTAFVVGDVDFEDETGAQVRDIPWVSRFTFNGKPDLKAVDYYAWVHMPHPK